jgi:predicted NAD-dependent protein-ADP-ribosyltransferase YbiA (DUF1768 family)
MSVTEKSLSNIIAPFAGNKYQALFTAQKGFLAWNGDKKCWEIQKKTPQNLGEYYNRVVEQLMITKAYQNIPHVDNFIRRLNSCRTIALVENPFSNSQTGKTHTIFFNSKDKNFNFLSNFHSTLILFKDHADLEEMRLYLSCENAYQTHKVKNLLSSQTEDAAINPEDTNSSETSEMLEKIANASPLESKELAKFAVFTKNTNEIAVMKHDLMREIVVKKFQDNPMLAQWLKQTGTAHLIENTSDSFWGAKDPHDPSLKKDYTHPITAESRNVLGRILMDVRAAL